MGNHVSSPVFRPFTDWSSDRAEQLLMAFQRHQMPFAISPKVCAALLRTGDKSLGLKQAQKWARAISSALHPTRPSNHLQEASGQCINALTLLSGIIALSNTSDAYLMSAAASRAAVQDKARLIFRCMSCCQLNQRGILTATELTILFISLWRAVGCMSGLRKEEVIEEAMRRNTQALVIWLENQAPPGKDDSNKPKDGKGTAKDWRPVRNKRRGRRRSPTADAVDDQGINERIGKITEEQFVAWAAVAVGKLHRPLRLPPWETLGC